MTNDLIMILGFVSVVAIICLTTIIHTILENRQERWKIEKKIKNQASQDVYKSEDIL